MKAEINGHVIEGDAVEIAYVLSSVTPIVIKSGLVLSGGAEPPKVEPPKVVPHLTPKKGLGRFPKSTLDAVALLLADRKNWGNVYVKRSVSRAVKQMTGCSDNTFSKWCQKFRPVEMRKLSSYKKKTEHNLSAYNKFKLALKRGELLK